MNRIKVRKILSVLLFCAAIPVACFTGCDSDDPAAVPATEDYFPFSRDYVWTYRSNFLASQGIPDTTFDLKIDTASYYNGDQGGLYWWFFGRMPSGTGRWGRFFSLLDSGNTVYSWGDFPSTSTPRTPPTFNFWKHVYATGEGVRETITVQGKTYSAVRVDYTGEKDVKISWWFANGIGLIREYSAKGGSILTDNNYGDSVEMNTELVSFTK